MKHIYFSLCLLFFVSNAFSQEAGFAPAGATWHYKMESMFTNRGGYVKLTVDRDTIIAGRNCAIIKATEFYKPNQQYTLDSTFIVTRDSLKVEYFTNGKFTTLYDFGAEQGDSWTIEEEFTTNKITVTATDSITMQGKKYKRLFVNAEMFGNDTIIEQIGSLNYFIPLPLTKDIRFQFSGLNCYADGDLTYKHIEGPCETMLHVGINDFAAADGQLAVYPNPFTASFTVKSAAPGKPLQIKIYNQSGKIVYSESYNADSVVLLPELAPGMYMLTAQDEKAMYKQVLIKL